MIRLGRERPSRSTRVGPVRHSLAACSLFIWVGGGMMATRTSAQVAPPPSVNRGAADLSPVGIQRLFDAYVVMQAQEALALSDAQLPKFLTRLKNLQEMRRRDQHARRQLMQELNRLTRRAAPRADDAIVRRQLEALREHDAHAGSDLRNAYDALDQVLDPRQQARFRVFEDQMERQKLELLLRARQGNRQRPLPRENPPRR